MVIAQVYSIWDPHGRGGLETKDLLMSWITEKYCKGVILIHSGIDGVFYDRLQSWEWSASKSVSFYAWVETTSNVPGVKVAAVTHSEGNMLYKEVCCNEIFIFYC